MQREIICLCSFHAKSIIYELLYICTDAHVPHCHFNTLKFIFKSLRSKWLKHTHLTLQTPPPPPLPHPGRIMRGPSQQGQRQELGVQTGWAPNPTLQAAACKMAVLLLSDGLLPPAKSIREVHRPTREREQPHCGDLERAGSVWTVSAKIIQSVSWNHDKFTRIQSYIRNCTGSKRSSTSFAFADAWNARDMAAGRGGGGGDDYLHCRWGGGGGNKDYIQCLWVWQGGGGGIRTTYSASGSVVLIHA